jgi:hypothetical protein
MVALISLYPELVNLVVVNDVRKMPWCALYREIALGIIVSRQVKNND